MPPTPSDEAALDAGLAAAFATENYESRAAGFIPAEVGTIIAGKYKLLERIGEGGMGSVWMAQQSEPMKRLVAVKFIKSGMDSRQVLARFEAERQALAVMDHPNIAKILDGGLTGEPGELATGGPQVANAPGSPYFVMELVKGVPITKYCDEHKLTPRQRLELFVPVCQAIQHAHQKGIIHRDIKPSNVIVALYDDKPVPKVIDFGVAKATGSTLTEQTLHTAFGGIIGTPEYMSPEQASLNNLDIDTRSDIYSLGVLLYELLAGSPPFKRKEFEQAGLLEILRVIREEEPPRPSTKLSSADALLSISANRGTEPKKLTGLLRNELDWIVMKALEKDRVRRYETANGFAADINRYLAGEPVNAHPPSAGYRFKKFLRKNKGPVIATAAVAIALLMGIVGFAWQAHIAQKERDTAKTETARAIMAETEIKKRADELKLVSDFQAQMLGQVDPTQAGKMLSDDVKAKFEAALEKAKIPEAERASHVKSFAEQWRRVNATDAARELIDRTILKPAVAAIDKQFANQPVVDASLRQVLANRYRDIGILDVAIPLQKQALSTRERVLGKEHPDTLASLSNLGQLLWMCGRFTESEPYVRRAMNTSRRVLGENHPNTLTSINNMGLLLQAHGKADEAEQFIRESLEKSRQFVGAEHPDTIAAINNMGLLLYAQGKIREAEPYYREALDKNQRVFGVDHLYTLQALGNVAANLTNQRRFTEAEPILREALERKRRVLGEDHPETIVVISIMAGLLGDIGRSDEAEALYREAAKKYHRLLGGNNLYTMRTKSNLGYILLSKRKFKEVVELLEPAEGDARQVFVDAHTYRLGLFLLDLARAQAGLGTFNVSESKLAEAHRIFVQTRGPAHNDTRDCTQAFISLYTVWHTAEPGQGYDLKAAEWKKKLEAIKN